ncbi:MAG: carboxymuconolactone decarboxylase family protein [Nocardioidaceae bacterium]
MSVEATSPRSLFDEGMTVRREVLGGEYVNRATTHDDPLTTEFQEFMTSYCWGEIWTDERLARRDRSLLVLAMTAALGKMAEFEAHAHGALRNGISPEQLVAVLRQITVYCGVPAGVTASKVLRTVLDTHQSDDTTPSQSGDDEQ